MTDKYAVIGNPIAHSKSPQIHKMFAGQTGQDISYDAILAPLDGFAAKVERLRKEGYKGCNVTVPFKFEAFKLTTEPSKQASAARAVNTLRFDDDTIHGDNTDGAGLVADIEGNLSVSLHGKRVLLMGAGGAAYGVALPLVRAGAHLDIRNRTEHKAQSLRDILTQASSGIGAYDAIHPEQITFGLYSQITRTQLFDVVINATSSGFTDEMLPLPNSIFAPGALAYDMMYGRETPFMKFARTNGAAIISDGLGMLVEQAAESFFIWRGVRPETAPVIAALRQS